MPHVSKNANFFEKGIKIARLATLTLADFIFFLSFMTSVQMNNWTFQSFFTTFSKRGNVNSLQRLAIVIYMRDGQKSMAAFQKSKSARETGILRVKGNTEAKVPYPFSGPFPRGGLHPCALLLICISRTLLRRWRHLASEPILRSRHFLPVWGFCPDERHERKVSLALSGPGGI